MDKPRRSRLTEADHAAWASYASRITPLPGRKRPVCVETPATADTPPAGSPARAPTQRPRPGAHVRGAHIAPTAVTVGTQPGGVDTATWQRLRTGKLRGARVLDLHGQTAQRAYHALVAFLRTAHADRLRCVEVVTGRGSLEGGVLRRELPLWLNLPEIRPLVLAASHPHAANPGSVRLLLRRPRGHPSSPDCVHGGA
jgi:DNA-nicking Smr family endonuclease